MFIITLRLSASRRYAYFAATAITYAHAIIADYAAGFSCHAYAAACYVADVAATLSGAPYAALLMPIITIFHFIRQIRAPPLPRFTRQYAFMPLSPLL